MRTKVDGNDVLIWASADDTYDWANGYVDGLRWPCSQLSDKRFFAAFDSNGLYELTVNGKDAPEDLQSDELNACISDLLFRVGFNPKHRIWDFLPTPCLAA